MASTVLPNGIIVPEKFSRDWYADLYHNWQELDNLLGGGTPKDGTLTIQKNGSTVGTFSANQATDETVNITVPDVNDATLTIQKNGTDVATFSANSSTNATANITVPTKTSDLTNDSGFITSDNTKIPLAGSNAISGSLIPATTNAYDLGVSSRKWKTLNGINPGALSLPCISSTGANAWIALDTTNWVKSPVTSAAQKYTPPADGWLNIRVNNATMLGLAITGGGNYMHQMVRSETPNGLALLIPVFKNTEVAILVAGNENLAYDRSTFYPCQGNV